MQVSVESGEGLQKHLRVDIPAERVSQSVDKKIAELAAEVRLDGFRPGKVPVRIVKQRFGNQVRQDVFSELIQETFYEAASSVQLTPAGDPKLELSESKEDGGFSYKATFDVVPEVELTDLSGRQVKRPVAEMTETDLDDMVEKLREQRATQEDVERAAQDGDTLYIDFAGTIHGEPFEGGEGEDLAIKLGSGRMVDGFESGLIGAQAGEERTLDVEFPAGYAVQHLAGQQARFVVQINRVTERRLPEMDAEFNRSYGVEEDSIEALRQEVRKNTELELARRLKNLRKNNVMDLIREANPLDIPQAMVNQEAEHLKHQMLRDMQMDTPQMADQWSISLFADKARERVHLGLLSTRIIEQQALQASEEDLHAAAARIAESYQEPDEVIDYYLNNANQRAGLENLVLEDKVVDWVCSQVEVVDEPMTFAKVMGDDTE